MAYRTYKDNLALDSENARLRFDEGYLIKNLLNQHDHAEATGSSIIDFIEPFSPVDELVKSSKIVRTGKNGVPSKMAFRKDHRNVHSTYVGNVAAHSTTESTDVGLVNYHTLGATISNKFGIYGHKPINFNENHWDSVSIDEALVPFLNSMDSGRLILARTHMGQKIPIINAQPPLIQTGAEHIVPKLTSPKFGHLAKQDGVVVDVKNNRYVHVQYDDGKTDVFDIVPRLSTTKRNSIIRITLDTLSKNDRFRKGDLVAWSKAFKDNTLAIGKNNRVAILNYMGRSHEDGYVISETMSNDFRSELIIKIPAIIPPDSKILEIKKIGEKTNINDILVQFQPSTTIDADNYINSLELYDDSPEMEEQPDLDQLYQFVSKSMDVLSPGGEIVDLKIKLNSQKNIDVMLLDIWEKQVKTINSTSKALGNKLLDNIDTSIIKVGGHKVKGKLYEGALVEFYIKIEKPANIGDKISNRFGAKGVINHIIPNDRVPSAEFSGPIDVFLAPAAILGRKNTVILKELYLGKLLVELKKIAKNNYNSNGFDSTKALISKFYDMLDESGKHKDNISALTDEYLKSKLNDNEFMFNLIIPPFSTITFKQIKAVADEFKISLDERVYIEELGLWSAPVPVGYAYMSTMEQLAGDYESTRSRAGYTSASGQPLKRKSRMGGQSLGNLDVYNLLTYDCNSTMMELMTVRSDNIRAKHQMINEITKTGRGHLPETIKTGKTQDLFKVLMLSIGLDIRGKF